MVQQLEGLRLY
ncbi:hypothetical protein GBAR_LOCUS15540 [Geodia barretti]|uniref:Uncharacterized protein n=1 Tax=Geodia barretti TaxID=519541 RepID=A0AA35WNP9_GEOBA|nr:hypothetical protein GBAR_LOCUS15540 [Geodia barretti]